MKKNRRALLVELQSSNAGILVRLHDAIQNDEGGTAWTRDILYTEKKYDRETFGDMTFPDKEMADFGYAIMARLSAFLKRKEI